MMFKICFFCFVLFVCKINFAQKIIIPVYFEIDAMESLYKIDSIKKTYNDEGFLLVKEASVVMTNNYESTIFLPLREGTWYKFVFVGDNSSKSLQQKLYDFSEKKIIALNQKPKVDLEENIMQFDYIPKFTEFHSLRSLQINKRKKNIGAYFLLFKKMI